MEPEPTLPEPPDQPDSDDLVAEVRHTLASLDTLRVPEHVGVVEQVHTRLRAVLDR